MESTLAEVEPIFRSTNGTFQFSHPSFQEVLTAKQFADEINSGRLSVRDAYVNFWSYVEDADLWDLPKDREWRALLPGWENVLVYMAGILDDDKAEELSDVVSESYFNTEKRLSERDYNPFFDDLFFSAKIVGSSRNKQRIKTGKITNSLISMLREKGFNKEISEALVDVGDDLAVDFLIESKEDYWMSRDPFVDILRYNWRFFEIFTKIGTKKSIDFLIKCMYSKDEISRYEPINFAAVIVLAKYGNKEAVHALIKYVKDKTNLYSSKTLETSVEIRNLYRSKALETLVEIRSKESLDFFNECIKDRNMPDREFIIGELSNEECVPALIECIKDKSDPHRLAAFIALKKIGSEKSLNFLIDYMQNKNNSDRVVAASILGRIGREEAVPALIDYINDISNPKEKRAWVVESLAEIIGEGAINFIIESLEYSPMESTVKLLGELKREEAVPALIKYWHDNISRDPDEDDSVLSALEEIGGKKVFSAFVEYINDKNNPYRWYILSKLGKVGGEEAIPYLIRQIQDKTNPDGDREWAAHALSEIESKETIPYLIEFIHNDDFGIIKRNLGEMASEETFDIFMAYLKDKTNPNRETAIKAIVNIKGEKVIPDLIGYMEDQDKNVRWEAICRLGEIGDYKAIKPLKELLSKYGNYVMVFDAIHSIHQRLKPSGYNPPVKRLVA